MGNEQSKACHKCGRITPLSGFYRDRAAPDGRRKSCIECDKARKRSAEVRAQAKRYYHSEKGKAAEQRYRESEKGKAVRAAYEERPERIAQRKAAGSKYTLAYIRRPKGQATVRAYVNRPEVQARRRLQDHTRRRDPVIGARMRTTGRRAEQRRLARKRRLPATFTAEQWATCIEAFGHRCAYCREQAPLVQEHFIPVRRGGPYTIRNIVPACRPCNIRKGNQLPEHWCTAEQYAFVMQYFHGLGLPLLLE